MASISHSGNGTRRILFTSNGLRRTLYLGKISHKGAVTIRTHVEHLVNSRMGIAVPPETAAWLQDLDAGLRKKLVRLGLVAPVVFNGKKIIPLKITLAEFIQDYIDRRKDDLKPRTLQLLNLVGRRLYGFFGQDKDITMITIGDGKDFRLHLKGKKLGESTIRRSIGIAKQLFGGMIEKNLITTNPFKSKDMPTTVKGNPAKFHFVTRAEIQKIIDACPNAEWRLLVALARYGGLRTPSEPLMLSWSDVNWAHSRICVRSPKTERHDGGDHRWVPMFPELLPYLQDAYDQARIKQGWVITRYRDSGTNLRTQLKRIALLAGVTLWCKPWQNQRATRETELTETFPAHVVAAWMGNSTPVANEFYLHVTDEHFSKAINEPTKTLEILTRNPTQQDAAPDCTTLHDENEDVAQLFDTAGLFTMVQHGAVPCSQEGRAWRDSNPQPSVPKTDALSN